jgi:hypothetical protein
MKALDLIFGLISEGLRLLDPGRFKEGVFGGDKVEVLIQHLLIEADQEGGYERCS